MYGEQYLASVYVFYIPYGDIIDKESVNKRLWTKTDNSDPDAMV